MSTLAGVKRTRPYCGREASTGVFLWEALAGLVNPLDMHARRVVSGEKGNSCTFVRACVRVSMDICYLRDHDQA